MKEQVWKTIEEFPDYEVSFCGEVRNKNTGKIKKQTIGKRGYYYTSFKKNGKQYSRTIHQVYAKAFIENPNNYPQVNHIDGNKLNNSIENLEWVSARDNILHARKTGLHMSDGDKPVLQILNGKIIKEFKSASEAGRILGLNRSDICNVCNHRKNERGYEHKSLGGFNWVWK